MSAVSYRVSALVDGMEAKLRGELGVGFNPVTRAAAMAFLEAEMNPGSLVRVTCKAADIGDFVGQLIGCDPSLERIDYESNRIGAKLHACPVILEFRNGSGIEITLERGA